MPYKNKIKQREYQSTWLQARRVKWLAENGPCVLCKSDLDLEVDHIDRDTKVEHRIWSWSAERREAELKKCQVLCRSCHLEKTIRENELNASTYGNVVKGI